MYPFVCMGVKLRLSLKGRNKFMTYENRFLGRLLDIAEENGRRMNKMAQ
jgi:hypothetical protein